MKILLFILMGLCYFGTPVATVQRWVIEKNSSLGIDGKTNINNFRCDIIAYPGQDTVVLYQEEKGRVVIKGGLSINVNCFDCHQKYITGDLRKTLKADEKPFFRIDLLSIGHFALIPGRQTVKGLVDIELAGVKRRMEVNYDITVIDERNIMLTGSRKMLFADFGLVPPRKLAGMIRVENEINVRYQLAMRMILQTTVVYALVDK